MASRLLTDAEIEFARQVFQDKLPYKKIHIAGYYLPGNQNVPVTLASVGSLIATRARRNYTIYFGPDDRLAVLPALSAAVKPAN